MIQKKMGLTCSSLTECCTEYDQPYTRDKCFNHRRSRYRPYQCTHIDATTTTLSTTIIQEEQVTIIEEYKSFKKTTTRIKK
ncbi:hypothetical protein AKO1_001216 [Acrasis kona]|uniref:Uncharacterized protein n=1 Tax=Acrasis kona TaxID=1008807 RepID=A0AAW2ZC61_9EUKA